MASLQIVTAAWTSTGSGIRQLVTFLRVEAHHIIEQRSSCSCEGFRATTPLQNLLSLQHPSTLVFLV